MLRAAAITAMCQTGDERLIRKTMAEVTAKGGDLSGGGTRNALIDAKCTLDMIAYLGKLAPKEKVPFLARRTTACYQIVPASSGLSYLKDDISSHFIVREMRRLIEADRVNGPKAVEDYFKMHPNSNWVLPSLRKDLGLDKGKQQ